MITTIGSNPLVEPLSFARSVYINMLTCDVRDILLCFIMLYASLDHCKCLPNSCTSVKQTLFWSDGQFFSSEVSYKAA